MLRRFHSVAAWIAALLLFIVALTGVVLAVNPLIDRAQAGVTGTSARAHLHVHICRQQTKRARVTGLG